MTPPSPILVALKNNQWIFSFFLVSLFMVFVWSYIGPPNRFIWYLDAVPAIIAMVLLLFTFRRFPFTPLAYILIWAIAIILLVGAHYTYPLVPPFNWLRDALQLNRNHFDRLVHLGQGFVPAIVVREILLRKTPLLPGRMLFFLVISVCLAASAFIEILNGGRLCISVQQATSFWAPKEIFGIRSGTCSVV